MIDHTDYIIHDLTLTYGPEISGYEEEVARRKDEDGWNAKWLKIYSHAGTHMDAPMHFAVNEKTIDQFKPKECMGRAWIVDIPIHVDQQMIGVEDLGGIKTNFTPADSILLRTGWSTYIGTQKYRNSLPRISRGLAEWCVAHHVKMLGVEAPSVADVNNLEEVTMIHEILLGGEVIILEGLCQLDQIRSNCIFLQALPIKTLLGDGAPARVIAWEKVKD